MTRYFKFDNLIKFNIWHKIINDYFNYPSQNLKTDNAFKPIINQDGLVLIEIDKIKNDKLDSMFFSDGLPMNLLGDANEITKEYAKSLGFYPEKKMF